MLFDNHSHTVFSSDSEMTAADAIAQAESLGLGLVFTEHYDHIYKHTKHYDGTIDFRFDPSAYWDQYQQYSGDKLRLGVEIGLTPDSRDANLAFLQQADFDLVIGSLHFMENLDLYYPDYYEGKDKAQAYGKYLSTMGQMIVENPYIDVLGHIDYICRYAPYEDKDIEYSDGAELIDKVLQAVIDNGIVMELNTRRLGDAMAVTKLMQIYRRYQQLGGQYITLGSDAHKAENIGMNFKTAQHMAECLKLKPVTFAERKMEYCK